MAALSLPRVRDALRRFDFEALFIQELGWDRHKTTPLSVVVDGAEFTLSTVAEKRGMAVFVCNPSADGTVPTYALRRKIENQVRRSAHEHLVIYIDEDATHQVWQWVRREPGRPAACREHRFDNDQPGDALIQKLQSISFSLDEEESLNITTVAGRTRQAFDVDRVTKKFYVRFKTEHGKFLQFIQGIQEQGDREWYASLMLNRLMFSYFIQKKGFLDDDTNYLRNRLEVLKKRKGSDKFHSFYRHFLLRLFHEGLGQQSRTTALDRLLGRVPYLNGGLFDVHALEREYSKIEIPDAAFEQVFDFFDAYQWHLDERPLRADNEINPDVLGYIFEKYINQKQMGAYYTKEDVTNYIATGTVIPALFEAFERLAPKTPLGEVISSVLRENPDRYIHHDVLYGLDRDLPKSVEQGDSSTLNQRAADDYGLPRETWREHVARRARVARTRNTLRVTDVLEIEDLLALNLDLRQLAQDIVENAPNPEFLRSLYRSIDGIAILDPTCGSGAFLFAALNILEPLYEACLERMESFAAESPGELGDFKKVLQRVESHPNRRYFVLKAIIIGNLFGVDIMEEAVEICKLRLFLKLVAQVDRVEDIEPLPDVDFNIRAGNSLVGFATYEECASAVTSRLDFDNTMSRIDENADVADRAFRVFREMQVEYGMDAKKFAAAKLELRERLDDLHGELDQYLASSYGVTAKEKLAAWRSSHKPFHWFVEFYGILKRGGFDVVLGNPPYVEYRNVTDYRVKDFITESCGDLYAFVLERALGLTAHHGHVGFIVPMSAFSVNRFMPLQRLFFDLTSPLLVSHWSGDAHPSRLFEGVDKRLQIVVGRRITADEERATYSSKYIKWYAEERPTLFKTAPVYRLLAPVKNHMVFPTSLPKVGCDLELAILDKIRSHKRKIELVTSRDGTHHLYYTRKVSFFLQFLDFVPEVLDARGQLREPSELKVVRFSDKETRNLALAALSSSLFYWFNIVNSDCRNLNKREIVSFPVPDQRSAARSRDIERVLERLMKSFQDNSVMKTVRYTGKGDITVQYFNFRPSKWIIDEMDSLLLPQYGLTAEEIEFIINYEIKYRMGSYGPDTNDDSGVV